MDRSIANELSSMLLSIKSSAEFCMGPHASAVRSALMATNTSGLWLAEAWVFLT